MGTHALASATATVALVAVVSPAAAAEAASESSPPSADATAQEPKAHPPAQEPPVRLNGGLAAGLGVLDAGCDDCAAVTSAGFGGQVGLRFGEPLFLGVGFAVATGASGTTTTDVVLAEASNDEVMFAFAGVARLYAVPSLFWGGGAGVISYAPRDRESNSGPFLMANAGFEFVQLEASNAVIGLELQARGTTALVDGYHVTTAAVLFGGTVMP